MRGAGVRGRAPGDVAKLTPNRVAGALIGDAEGSSQRAPTRSWEPPNDSALNMRNPPWAFLMVLFVALRCRKQRGGAVRRVRGLLLRSRTCLGSFRVVDAKRNELPMHRTTATIRKLFSSEWNSPRRRALGVRR